MNVTSCAPIASCRRLISRPAVIRLRPTSSAARLRLLAFATAKNVRSSPQKRPLSSARSSKANRRNECDPFGNGCCIAQFNPRIDEVAFYDSGLRIVRHIWFVETKLEFATLHCVRLSPDWGGMSLRPRSGIARNRDAPLTVSGDIFTRTAISATVFPSAGQLRASHSLVRNDQLFKADKYIFHHRCCEKTREILVRVQVSVALACSRSPHATIIP